MISYLANKLITNHTVLHTHTKKYHFSKRGKEIERINYKQCTFMYLHKQTVFAANKKWLSTILERKKRREKGLFLPFCRLCTQTHKIYRKMHFSYIRFVLVFFFLSIFPLFVICSAYPQINFIYLFTDKDKLCCFLCC